MVMAHVGGALLLGVVPLAWPLKILIGAALAASLLHAWRQHAARTARDAITGFEIDSEGGCAVRHGPPESGHWRTCELRQAVAHPWGVLLSIRVQGDRLSRGLVMAVDAIDPEPFRRLRARLRLQTRAV